MKFGEEALQEVGAVVSELVKDGLIEQRDDLVCLTSRGRLLSNEVFERFIVAERIAS
jgi:oxygen-independent coproporphyrinogen-3 oxidase